VIPNIANAPIIKLLILDFMFSPALAKRCLPFFSIPELTALISVFTYLNYTTACENQ